VISFPQGLSVHRRFYEGHVPQRRIVELATRLSDAQPVEIVLADAIGGGAGRRFPNRSAVITIAKRERPSIVDRDRYLAFAPPSCQPA
jgi:hypothetical protein